jgi:hypothetical protein
MPVPKRKPITTNRMHLHRCGDYDKCHEEEPLLTDCRQCQRDNLTIIEGGPTNEPSDSPGT